VLGISVVEEGRGLILHACLSMLVFNELRNWMMYKECNVQIWNASYDFKRHQFAPTLDLLVTLKVKFVQIRKIRVWMETVKSDMPIGVFIKAIYFCRKF
jgi:hypothetical protein